MKRFLGHIIAATQRMTPEESYEWGYTSCPFLFRVCGQDVNCWIIPVKGLYLNEAASLLSIDNSKESMLSDDEIINYTSEQVIVSSDYMAIEYAIFLGYKWRPLVLGLANGIQLIPFANNEIGSTKVGWMTTLSVQDPKIYPIIVY